MKYRGYYIVKTHYGYVVFSEQDALTNPLHGVEDAMDWITRHLEEKSKGKER